MSTHSTANLDVSVEPSPSDVEALARKLNADLANGLVSPRAYDHRSRVIRQQAARLLAEVPSALEGANGSNWSPPQIKEAIHGARDPTSGHYTIFRSAAEECAARGLDCWENEGGHTMARAGRIALTPEGPKAYKVVLGREDGTSAEQGCATMREAEEIMRGHMPVPMARDTSRDRAAGEA